MFNNLLQYKSIISIITYKSNFIDYKILMECILMNELRKISFSFTIIFVLVLMSNSVLADDAADRLAVYKSGIEGMKLLRDRSIYFYQQMGYMPSLKQLLETPLNDQPPNDTDLLTKYNVWLLYAEPIKNGSCPVIKLQGTIFDLAKVPTGTEALKIVNTLFVAQVNGNWVTICMYDELGPNANPSSLHIDYCYNLSIPDDKAHVERQLAGLESRCK